MVIHKIGVVPVARFGDEVRLLIHKPRPKQGDADIAWGLARGTRMYFDNAAQEWCDARERAVAEKYRDHLEDPHSTALREMEEELDVLAAELHGGALRDFGVIEYASQQRMAYPIQWFSGWVMNPERERTPHDAAGVRWITVVALRSMAERGEFKKSYLPIAEAVVERMQRI